MGFYINRDANGEDLPAKDKYGALIQLPGAKAVKRPVKLEDWTPDLVCCVMNPTFEAAAYAFDAAEMLRFAGDDYTGRPQRWLVAPGAAILAGYKYHGDPIRRLNGVPVPTDTRNPDFDD